MNTLVFEEFHSQIPIGDMHNYLDIYPLMLPARYNDKVADLLFAGRSKKIVTIISLQRADAIYFPRGAKEQVKKIVMMGQISKTQLEMLLDEDMQNKLLK